MDQLFVSSLEHMASEKVVMFLLDDSDLLWGNAHEYQSVKTKVMEKIPKLMLSEGLQKKLKTCIAPLLFGVEDWIADLEKYLKGVGGYYHVRMATTKSRLPDGTIDKEKCLDMLVKGEDLSPIDRFITACIFCLFEDVPVLWNCLNRIEKAYLRNDGLKSSNIPNIIYRHWIEWLESNRERDWPSFAAWTLETPIWKSNIYMMKRILRTLSPLERSQYLLKALTETFVSSDIMWFGLSMLSGSERQLIYRVSPLPVFRCILSWPVRHAFLDFAKKLWPYVDEDTFFRILEMMVKMINDEITDCLELIVILKTFWAERPDHYKKIVENEKYSYRFTSIKFVLQHDLSKPFHRRRIPPPPGPPFPGYHFERFRL